MIRQDLPQERQMGVPPGRDVIVVVAIGDRPANHQQQDLRQGVRHSPRLARILDGGEMVEQGTKARFLAKGRSGQGHGASPNQGHPENHGRRKP